MGKEIIEKIEKMWLLSLGQPQKIIYNEKNYVSSATKVEKQYSLFWLRSSNSTVCLT